MINNSRTCPKFLTQLTFTQGFAEDVAQRHTDSDTP